MKLKLLAIAILLILTLNKIQAQIPSYIPKDSLVGWWPFDGNANDLSGNNNHGDTFNLTPTADRNSKLNSAYLFNGVSSYIKIPKSQKNGMTSNWTVTAWIYTNGFNGVSQYQTLFSKRNDGIWAHSLALSYTGGTSENEYVVAGRRDQAQNIDLKYSSDKFFKNKWIHLTTTCKNDTIRYYFDGKQIGNFQVFNIQVPNQDVDISIGRICACPSGHPEWFNGKIDDIGLWSRPLDSNEVKSIFNSCPKKITSEPQSVTTNNRFATFSCTANDTLQSFQWQKLKNGTWTNIKDSGQYSGCKTNKLFVNHILKVNNNEQFRCQIKGNCINTFTQAVSLNFNCKIQQTNKPKNYGLFGGNAMFVSNNNDTLVDYQWQTNQGTGWNNLFNAGQYSGVNNDTLVVENISASNTGQLFRCIMQGDCGKDTSIVAKLSVWGVNIGKVVDQKISVYPNPVKNTLTVTGLNNFYFEIQNLPGQSVLSGFAKDQINIELLPTGVFILKINNQKVKFIKE